MKKLFAFLFLSIGIVYTFAQSTKLTGTIIGTAASVDYTSGSMSTTVNIRENAFDGDLNTFFASYPRSNSWVGLDLGTPHVITKVGWSPRNDSNGSKRVKLGVFEGANSSDFIDAVPLYLIDKNGTIGVMSNADIDVTRGFRYVRYMGPNDARCNVAEIEFYGYESEGSDEKFYQPTNLPLVVVNVKNAKEPQDKVTDLDANIIIISEDGTNYFENIGTTRLRGNASMNFEKKPYRIKFEKKQQVLDAKAKAKKWTLINNYGDKTLMRNLIAFEISRRLNLEYTPYGRAVDVIFNGEYKGTYQLCDQVEVNKNRVNVEEMDEKCVEGEDLTGGYLVEIDAYAYDEDNYFYSKRQNPVTIKYPDSDEILSVQTSYIKEHFNKLEDALFSSSFTNETKGYRKYLDLESFLKHFIVGELSGNTDTYWSVNMYKHRNDDHFYVGPVWDFDIAFENDYRTYPINSKSDYVYASGGSLAGNMKNFVDQIIKKDSGAKEELKNIWSEVRNSGVITPENITDFVKDLQTELNQSQKLNFTRWDILNQKVHMNPKTYGGYNGEVNNVIKFLQDRIAWLDKKIGLNPTSIEEINMDDENAFVEIFNLSGMKIGEYKEIDSKVLAPGIYIVKEKGISRKIQIR